MFRPNLVLWLFFDTIASDCLKPTSNLYVKVNWSQVFTTRPTNPYETYVLFYRTKIIFKQNRWRAKGAVTDYCEKRAKAPVYRDWSSCTADQVMQYQRSESSGPGQNYMYDIRISVSKIVSAFAATVVLRLGSVISSV